MSAVTSSGVGTRHGAGGIRKYCSTQGVMVTPRFFPTREISMYPNRRWSANLLARATRLVNGGRGR
jgi:hypothetical protein